MLESIEKTFNKRSLDIDSKSFALLTWQMIRGLEILVLCHTQTHTHNVRFTHMLHQYKQRFSPMIFYTVFYIFHAHSLTPTLYLSLYRALYINTKHVCVKNIKLRIQKPYMLMNSISTLPCCTFLFLWLVCFLSFCFFLFSAGQQYRNQIRCVQIRIVYRAKPRGNVIWELSTLFNRVLRCKIMGRKQNTAWR